MKNNVIDKIKTGSAEDIKYRQDTICKLIVKGHTLDEIEEKVQVDIFLVYRWLEEPEHLYFQEKYRRAQLIKNEILIEKTMQLTSEIALCQDKEELSTKKLQIDTYKWIIKLKNELIQQEIKLNQNKPEEKPKQKITKIIRSTTSGKSIEEVLRENQEKASGKYNKEESQQYDYQNGQAHLPAPE